MNPPMASSGRWCGLYVWGDSGGMYMLCAPMAMVGGVDMYVDVGGKTCRIVTESFVL